MQGWNRQAAWAWDAAEAEAWQLCYALFRWLQETLKDND